MVPNKIVVLQEHLPASLPAGQTLQLLEVSQVLVISENHDRVGGASKVLVPLR